MYPTHKHLLLLIILLTLSAAGCRTVNTSALPGFESFYEPLDAPDRLLVELDILDARYQPIKGFEHAMVSPAMRWQIEQYAKQEGLEAKKKFIKNFLQQARDLNDSVMKDAVPKVPSETLAKHLDHFVQEHPEIATRAKDGSLPQRFLAAYLKHASDEWGKTLTGLEQLSDPKELDQYWATLIEHIDESIKTKGRTQRLLATAPLVPFIYSWIWYHAVTDDRSAHEPHFARALVFRPEGKLAGVQPASLTKDWDLLRYYAPTVVQEIAENISYPASSDRFGEVFLSGSTPEEATPGVHSHRPTLYAYSKWNTIQGGETRQLIYTLWYPEHPKLKTFDPEAGPMEGWTMRITLNTENRPMIYESVSNCGCYYKVFPTDRLESLSQQVHPTLDKDKRFHLEKNLKDRIDTVMPELVPFDPPGPVTLYYSAGHHQLVTIRAPGPLAVDAIQQPSEPYQLLPYENLENLPFHNLKESLFDSNGLVRKAHRLECTLLVPSGLFHAGHPRQRETQMIYFDQAELDDPNLFEQYLYLPPAAFSHRAP